MLNQTLNIENLKKYPLSVSFPKGLDEVSIERPFNNAKAGLSIMETWKDIPKYEGSYQASTFGRIKSLERFIKHRIGGRHIQKERILKQAKIRGYYTVRLSSEKSSFTVHRLIALSFIPNPENKPCINHKNCIKSDNRIENLEWVTYSENMKHAYKMGMLSKEGEKNPLSKLKKSDIIKIRELYKNNTQTKIAELFNMNQTTISRILTRKSWKHIL